MLTTLATYPAEEIFPLITAIKTRDGKKKKLKHSFWADNGNTYIVNVSSTRLNTLKKQPSCVCCGLTGVLFKLQQHVINEPPHLNLYGYDVNGRLVMLTKDHIIPASKGGHDGQSNMQTMCATCNELKDDNFLEVEKLKKIREEFSNQILQGLSHKKAFKCALLKKKDIISNGV